MGVLFQKNRNHFDQLATSLENDKCSTAAVLFCANIYFWPNNKVILIVKIIRLCFVNDFYLKWDGAGVCEKENKIYHIYIYTIAKCVD